MNLKNILLALFISALAATPIALADSESQCEITIIVINIQDGFKSQYDADRFCSPFFDFCSVRRYGTNRYEGSFRYRHTFRAQDRRNAWDQYHDFIGRNKFLSGFNHSFSFKGC
jgi:hypothetical protein